MSGPGPRLARTQWAPLLALAVLALVAAVLAVAVPSWTAAGYDRGAAAAAGPGGDIEVEGRAGGTTAITNVSSEEALVSHAVAWQRLLPASIAGVAGRPEASVVSDAMFVRGRAQRPSILYLDWDAGARERVRTVMGRPTVNVEPAPGADVQIMVSREYADKFGYSVGDRLTIGDLPDAAVHAQIMGLYEPVNPVDPYWTPRAGILHPSEKRLDRETTADVGTALMDESGYRALARAASDRLFTFHWRFPIRATAIDAAKASEIAADMDAFRSAVEGRTAAFHCSVVTALDDELDRFAGQYRAARSVLGLVLGGLVAVAAGVLLLAAGLLGERLRPVLGTMRTRGASLRQLAVPACGLTALAAVPAGALGYAAGRLLDAGPPQPSSAYAVALLVAATLAVSAAVVLRERGGGLESSTGHRDDIGAARPSPRRLVLEALLVALAVVGVVLLRRRGQEAGTDPLIAAVPVLLAAAFAVLVLRAYPYLLRAAAPVLRRRRGVVAFLGFARAARQGLVGVLPVVVLLLVAAVAGFTATVDTALRAGQVRASWAEVGAEARVETGPLDEAGLRRIRAVPGVTGAVRVRVIEHVSTQSNTAPVTVIGVDLDAYRALAPDVPGLPGGHGVLASPLAARDIGSGEATLSRAGMDPIRVRAPRVIERFPGRTEGAFVVVPYADVARATGFPSQVFVAGHGLDVRELRAAAPGHGVTMRRDVLRDLNRAPLVSVIRDTFQSGALIGGGFGLLAVLFVLVVGARARARTIAHLRALGLSRRQSRGLALVEIAPVLVCATAAGWVLGLMLPEITGPVVDLRPYTGGYAVPAHVPDLPASLGLVGALLLAAAAAVAVDRLFDARPGTVLRSGDL